MEKYIGILTFHYARNYGAVLQAYALQNKIQNLCDRVEIIDYRNSRIMQELALWCLEGRDFKSLVRAIGSFIYRARKKWCFAAFEKKRMVLSVPLNKKTLSAYVKRFNILITGSDQVWNGNLTDNDMTYYLDIANDKQFKIAYAVSLGDVRKHIGEQESILLKKFDFISLREMDMEPVIEQIAKKEVYECCDPTLLLNSKEWECIASKRLVKKPYLFLFMIEESPILIQYAQKVADEKGLLLVSNKNCISFFIHPSPNDFLSWILHADYVLTNSFHGTVFSVLLKKQFLSNVVSNDGTEKGRIVHLLKMCGLEHRTLNNKENLDKTEKWDEVTGLINSIRQESWDNFKCSLHSFEMKEYDEKDGGRL